MDSAQPDLMIPEVQAAPPIPVKIVVAGGFAVGKTTFVGSISEILPLTTEAVMTAASTSVDDLGRALNKTSTTVAMDFGRLTLGSELILYLFGTPGQPRFMFMWEELARGAIGAVVLVDTGRLGESFPAVDYFEKLGMPFLVAVNRFNGEMAHSPEQLREALDIGNEVPILYCDARVRSSTKEILMALVELAIARSGVPVGAEGR